MNIGDVHGLPAPMHVDPLRNDGYRHRLQILDLWRNAFATPFMGVATILLFKIIFENIHAIRTNEMPQFAQGILHRFVHMIEWQVDVRRRNLREQFLHLRLFPPILFNRHRESRQAEKVEMILDQMHILLIHHTQGTDRLPATLDRHSNVSLQPERLNIRITDRIRRILEITHHEGHITPLPDHIVAKMPVRSILVGVIRRRLPLTHRAQHIFVQPVVQRTTPAKQTAAHRHQSFDIRLRVRREFQQTLRERT